MHGSDVPVVPPVTPPVVVVVVVVPPVIPGTLTLCPVSLSRIPVNCSLKSSPAITAKKRLRNMYRRCETAGIVC